MNTQAAEFHCWHAPTREEALRKGELLGSVYHRFLKEGPVVDLGCGEGALLLWLKEHGHTRVLGVESSAELSSLAESWGGARCSCGPAGIPPRQWPRSGSVSLSGRD